MEAPSKIQSADQKELTKIAYEIINVTEQFATVFQEFKTIDKRIGKVECTILENKIYKTFHDNSGKSLKELYMSEEKVQSAWNLSLNL